MAVGQVVARSPEALIQHHVVGVEHRVDVDALEIPARLEKERTTLEGRITELRNFERDYRSQLRSYIEGQLRDLDTTATSSGSTPVSAIGL